MQLLYRILHNLPWPLSRLAPSFMEFPDGTLVRAYTTTPVQRYVSALLIDLADTPPHQLSLTSDVPLPAATDFPAPLFSFKKVATEIKRISQFEHKEDQGLYTGRTYMSIRLHSTNEMADFTLDIRIQTREKITTIHAQFTSGHPAHF
jgi:hypothetical protein